MNLLFFLIISCALLLCTEITKRQFKLSPDLTRKLTHIGAAIIAAAAPLFIDKSFIITVCLIFAVILFLSHRSRFFSSIHDVKRNTFGEVFLPIGEALAAFIFLPHEIRAYQFGVLIMGISDPLAGLIGEKYGKHKASKLGGKKSIEGSAVFFFSAIFITYFFIQSLNFQLIVIPFLLTIVEYFLGYGLDNLALPLVGAYLLITLI